MNPSTSSQYVKKLHPAFLSVYHFAIKHYNQPQLCYLHQKSKWYLDFLQSAPSVCTDGSTMQAMCSTRKPFRTPLKLAETQSHCIRIFIFICEWKCHLIESAPSPVLDCWLITIMMSQRVYDLTKSQESKHKSSHLISSQCIYLIPDTVAQ